MDIRERLLQNLLFKYGSLANASRTLNISYNILQNWSYKASYPNLEHLQLISVNSQINASFWISDNFLILTTSSFFSQSEKLTFYLQMNIQKMMREKGKSRSQLIKFDKFQDQMSSYTFDNYRFGRTKRIPLFRLEELAFFFDCKPQKLIEVTSNE